MTDTISSPDSVGENGVIAGAARRTIEEITGEVMTSIRRDSTVLLRSSRLRLFDIEYAKLNIVQPSPGKTHSGICCQIVVFACLNAVCKTVHQGSDLAVKNKSNNKVIEAIGEKGLSMKVRLDVFIEGENGIILAVAGLNGFLRAPA